MTTIAATAHNARSRTDRSSGFMLMVLSVVHLPERRSSRSPPRRPRRPPPRRSDAARTRAGSSAPKRLGFFGFDARPIGHVLELGVGQARQFTTRADAAAPFAHHLD